MESLKTTLTKVKIFLGSEYKNKYHSNIWKNLLNRSLVISWGIKRRTSQQEKNRYGIKLTIRIFHALHCGVTYSIHASSLDESQDIYIPWKKYIFPYNSKIYKKLAQ